MVHYILFIAISVSNQWFPVLEKFKPAKFSLCVYMIKADSLTGQMIWLSVIESFNKIE